MAFGRRNHAGSFFKGLFTREILCLAIDILECVFNRRKRQGQTTANHKRISYFVDCHEFITNTKMTIATS